MEFVVLGVLLFVAAVIAVDTVRQRRIRRARDRPPGRPRRSAGRGGTAILPAAPGHRARARASDARRRLPRDRRHPRGGRPPAPTAGRAEVRIFRLRWGNDYATTASTTVSSITDSRSGKPSCSRGWTARGPSAIRSSRGWRPGELDARASPISSWPCTGRFPRSARSRPDELSRTGSTPRPPAGRSRFGKTLSIE